MMKKSLILSLCLAALWLCGQPFASGKHAIAYQIDLKQKSMTVISETAYDPRKEEGTSVHTLYWNDQTRFDKRSMVPFASVKPGSLGWFFLANKDIQSIKEGKVFSCRRIEFEPEKKLKEGFQGTKLCAPVNHMKRNWGQILYNGRKIRFKGPAEVAVFTKGKVSDIKPGKQKLRIFGKIVDGKFIISRLHMTDQPKDNFDPALPSVLVVGDSISMNYEKALVQALKGKMNCRRIEGNSGDSIRGNSALRLWLGDLPGAKSQWGAVVLNHGLHDLKQKADPKTKVFSPVHQVEPAVYAKNIDRLLKFLTENKYHVVWCTTTPVPNSSYGAFARRKDEDLVYNKVLEPVLKKYPQVVVCDLNAIVRNSKVFDEWRKGSNVPFMRPAEQQLLGNAVAAAVLKAAGIKGETSPSM